MEFSAEMIASFLEGEVVGNKDVTVNNVAKIEEGKPGTLAFLANPKYESYIYSTEASIVIVNRDFQPSEPVKATLVKVDDAYACFAKLLDLYVANKPQKTGVSPLASINSSAKVAEDVYVGEFAVIEQGVTIACGVKIYPHVYIGDGVKIGEGSVIMSGAVIYEGCVIGKDCTVHSGSVIGADGFGFAPQADGSFKKIPQIGNVILEDGVDIGANTCVDCATMGSTIIHKGVKLDNLIQIGHNVQIGENTVAAAQIGVAGSTKVGKSCMIGGQVGIAGHLTVADNVHIGSQSGIGTSIRKNGEVLMGSPAFSARDYQRSSVVIKWLPEMHAKMSELEKEIAALKEQLGGK